MDVWTMALCKLHKMIQGTSWEVIKLTSKKGHFMSMVMDVQTRNWTSKLEMAHSNLSDRNGDIL